MASVQSQHPDTLKAHRHVAAESLIAITGPERGGPQDTHSSFPRTTALVPQTTILGAEV